jgi:hypothetical protein
MQHLKDLRDWTYDHRKASGSLLLATVVLWGLIFLGVVPRYDRDDYQDVLAYFFPIWVVIGYVGYALLSGIAKEQLAKETPEEKEQYEQTLFSD